MLWHVWISYGFLSQRLPQGTIIWPQIDYGDNKKQQKIKVTNLDFPKKHCQKRFPTSTLSIWVFPKILVPPNHPFVHSVFHYKPSFFWGKNPIFGNIHIFWCHGHRCSMDLRNPSFEAGRRFLVMSWGSDFVQRFFSYFIIDIDYVSFRFIYNYVLFVLQGLHWLGFVFVRFGAFVVASSHQEDEVRF